VSCRLKKRPSAVGNYDDDDDDNDDDVPSRRDQVTVTGASQQRPGGLGTARKIGHETPRDETLSTAAE